VLLAITYGLVSNSQAGEVTVIGKPVVGGPQALVYAPAGAGLPPPLQSRLGARTRQTQAFSAPAQAVADQARATIRRLASVQSRQLNALAGRAQHALANQRSSQRDALLTESGIALGIMALISIGLGWLMAGRALRPLRLMNARARGISERSLHQRLAVAGPDDELSDLAGTFDGLLARLETAFESQRRFVANASHELRTPIAVSRTLVEVALADPTPSVPSMRSTLRRVLAADEQQERTIEALLTLARSQRGIEARERLDLAEIAAEALASAPPVALTIETAFDPAPALGDRALLERMAANLIDNAITHNVEGGWVRVRTGCSGGLATLLVANSGPVVPPERVQEMYEPFRRLDGQRTANGRGLGLGLSIAKAIIDAHGARIESEPGAGGGLEIEVSFPAAGSERVLPPV
jgi:signal transduction histidine kinase